MSGLVVCEGLQGWGPAAWSAVVVSVMGEGAVTVVVAFAVVLSGMRGGGPSLSASSSGLLSLMRGGYGAGRWANGCRAIIYCTVVRCDGVCASCWGKVSGGVFDRDGCGSRVRGYWVRCAVRVGDRDVWFVWGGRPGGADF